MRPGDPRLRAPLRPARTALAGVAVAGVAGGVLVIAQAWAITALLLALIDHRPLTGPALAVGAVLLGRGLVGVGGDLAAARAAARVGTVLRQRLVLAALDRATPCGDDVATLATRGVTAAEPYLTRYLPAVVLAGVLPPLTVLAIATRDLLSAGIVMATLPLVPVFGALVGLATRDRAEEQWRSLALLSGHFLDVVRGLPTLVAHRRARAQRATIATMTERYRLATLRTLRIAFASSAVLELVATLSVALVAVTVGVRLAAGHLDLRTALVVLLLAPEAYWPLRRMGAEFHAAAEGAATFAAAHDLLATAPARRVPAAPPAHDAPLVLDHLTVTHRDRSEPVWRDLSAIVPAHGVTVVTGPSGCGKSTLLAAIAGLLPEGTRVDGRIAVGGLDADGEAWRRQVAWLPQQPRFVAGTIADNLRLGRPDADDDALWAALAEVALEERVRALPDGLATAAGEDGATLSAGERARLALARVVLAARAWVLLDEPTAHLDELTEQVVADTIAALGRRGGVIVVAHRPHLVAMADRLLTLSAAATDAPSDPLSDPSPDPSPARRSTPPPPATTDPAGADPAEDHPRRLVAAATVLGTLASASGVALTATAGWLIVQASSRPAVLTLLVAVVGVRAFGLARPVLRYAERLLGHDAALRLLARRRVEVYDALVPLVPGRIGRRGDLLTAVVDDVDAELDLTLRVHPPVLQQLGVTALAATVAGVLLPPAGLVVAGAGLLGAAGAYGLARAAAARAQRRLVSDRALLAEQVVEALELRDDLVMWQQTRATADRIGATGTRLGRASAHVAFGVGAARAWVLAVTAIALACVGAVAADAHADGRIGAPVLALLVLLPLALADVTLPLADAGALAVRTAAARDRLADLERVEPAVRDVPGPALPHGHDLHTRALRGRWALTAPASAPIDLDLAPGARVGVVGPSGSGKSTLAAMLLRFIDPLDGDGALGGVPLADLCPDVVRARVGLVDDHPHVFATTVLENVRLARPDATDDEVLEALRRARLAAWVAGLPDGADTWIGAGHGAVSGGERARLGVARSLLADHPVLVLDEPTAHLDHATARALAAEVLGGARHRSTLWITHASVGLDLVDDVVALGGAPRPSLVE